MRSRARLAVVPIALAMLLGPVSGQAVELPLERVIRTQPYDVLAGGFVGHTPHAGVASSLIYDNGDDILTYVPCQVNEIYLDWGRLTGFGENAITQAVICYGTTNTNPVEVTFRLHSGLEDKTDPGAGLELHLTGLPPSPDGGPIGYQIPLFFPSPIYLPDGPIRYSIQGHDSVTGPAFAEANPALEITNKIQFFSFKGAANPNFDLGTNGNPRSIFLELTGVPHEFDHSATVQSPLTGKDQYIGQLANAQDSDVFRLDTLPDQQITVSVVAASKSGLLPGLTVNRVVGGAELASDAPGKNKAGVKKLVIPGGGPIAISVSALEGSGAYRLKLTTRLDKASRKPAVDTSGLSQGALLSSFEAQAGAQLNATVFPQPKDKQVPPPPVVEGPTGVLPLGSALKLQGGKWVLRKLELPASGLYRLRAGTLSEADEPVYVDLPVSAKLSIRPPKLGAGRGDELADALHGTWVQDEFITVVDRYTASFDSSVKGGAGELTDKQPHPQDLVTMPTITLTSQLASWSVVAVDGAPDGERRLTYMVDSVTVTPPVFEQPASTQAVVRRYQHPGGNPDVLRFLGAGGELAEIWRRDTAAGPDAPEVSSLSVDGPDPGAASLTALRIAFDDDVDHYLVFKGGVTDEVLPVGPMAVHVPRAAFDGLEQFSLFTDFSSADGVPANYWVVAVDASGNRGIPSFPVSVF